jgi:glycerol-3-phosphate dehydrogenase (NAD(P)+)
LENKNTITILGAGAWGTALATLLARNGYQVKLWCFEVEVADAIAHARCNERYLPDVYLDISIEPTPDLAYALRDATYIIEAVPVQCLRSILFQAQPFCTPDQTWIVTSKGIEKETLLLPTQIVEDVFPFKPKMVALSGPSFARDLANDQLTAVNLGTNDASLGKEVKRILTNEMFIPHLSNDLIGMQMGGALKNVIALGVGILDGAGYTDNTKAFFITRGFQELVLLATAIGATQETMYGLSGLGDTILTATGSQSKNLTIGKRIGSGERLAEIAQTSEQLPEGINTLQSIAHLIHRLKLDAPICTGLYQVVFENKKIANFLSHLSQAFR